MVLSWVVLLSFAVISPIYSQLLSAEGKNAEDLQVKCYWEKGIYKLRCTRPEVPDLHHNGTIWPTSIIIGSFKTGTSALIHMLNKSKKVVVANSAKANKVCCGPEIYFLDQDEEIGQGFGRYAQFFRQSANETFLGFEQAMEKTPTYSYDPLVPYRARVILPRNTKYLFTFRDPTEAQMSLYLYRGLHLQNQVNFKEYISYSIPVFEAYMECRERVFNYMIVPDSKGNTDWLPAASSSELLFDDRYFSWETTHNIERHIYQRCGMDGRYIGKIPFPQDHHFMQMYLNPLNLRRWVHAVGRENVICVRNDDELSNPSAVRSRVSKFLGLDEATTWGESLVRKVERDTTLMRLIESQHSVSRALDIGAEVLEWVNRTAAIYRKYTSPADEKFLREICPLIDSV